MAGVSEALKVYGHFNKVSQFPKHCDTQHRQGKMHLVDITIAHPTPPPPGGGGGRCWALLGSWPSSMFLDYHISQARASEIL